MFSDPSFSSTVATSTVDEYGRVRRTDLRGTTGQRPDLQRAYGISANDVERMQKTSPDDDKDDDDDESDESDEVDDDDDDDDDNDNDDDDDDDDDTSDVAQDEDDVDDSSSSSSIGRGAPIGKPTKRLAIVKCDWDHVTAVDLLYVLRSQCPPGGSVFNVTVYPSDFGLERMKDEEFRPPDVFKLSEEERAAAAAAAANENGDATFQLEEVIEDVAPDAPALNDTAELRRLNVVDAYEVQDDADDEPQLPEVFDDDLYDEAVVASEGSVDSNDDDEEVVDPDAQVEDDDDDDDNDDDDDESTLDSSDDAMKTLFADVLKQQQLGAGAEEEEDGFDRMKLRRYQRDRLKYFYAIAECDSAATAAALFSQCSGTELEATANVLDIKYVPDGMTFDERDPREVATAVPDLYEAPRWFTRAVAHTRVSLTWDEADPDRVARTTRQWTVQDLVNDEQFNDLIANSEDGSEFSSAGDLGQLPAEDDDADDHADESSETREARLKQLRTERRKLRIRKKYAPLLASISGPSGGGDDNDDDDDDDNDNGDDGGGEEMEITFKSGFTEDAPALRERFDATKMEKLEKERTWWEVTQEKRAELKTVRHQAKLEADKLGLGPEETREHVLAAVQRAKDGVKDAAFADPFANFEQGFDKVPDAFHDEDAEQEDRAGLSKKEQRKLQRKEQKKKARKAAKEARDHDNDPEVQRKRAELELIMMPSGGDDQAPAEAEEGFSMRGLLAANNKKTKAGKKAVDTDHGPVSKFEFDTADPRFAAVLEKPAFAIDPHDPHFFDTAGMRDVLQKRAERQAELREKEALARRQKREKPSSASTTSTTAEAPTAPSTATSGAAVDLLISGIKKRSLEADRLPRGPGADKKPRLVMPKKTNK
jgi:hypothetical protein